MFESRLQIAQVGLFASGILLGIAILTFIFGAMPVGIFVMVLSHGAAAAGNYFYAESKGYPPLIAVPLGIAFGIASAVIYVMLPDENKESVYQSERRLSGEAMRNAQKRDRGYEVLDDDDED